MQGLHLTADLYQCAGDTAYMLCADTLAALCRTQVHASGLTLVDDKWVTFPPYNGQPGGVTGTVLLAESHLAIHTWPECSFAAVDIFMCGAAQPQLALDVIQNALQAAHCQLQSERRAPPG